MSECEATIADDSPVFTGCTGVAYSIGYSFRCDSIATFTRSSSCIETVLIQVIASVLCVLWALIFANQSFPLAAFTAGAFAALLVRDAELFALVAVLP